MLVFAAHTNELLYVQSPQALTLILKWFYDQQSF